MPLTRRRRILAVVIALIAGNLTFLALESASQQLYPPPKGLDLADPKAVDAFVRSLPTGAFLLILATYACGSFVSGAVAAAIANRSSVMPALIVGGMLTVGGALNLVSIHHPLWFAVVSTLVYVPFAWMGARMVVKK